jgi:hypothetical protein
MTDPNTQLTTLRALRDATSDPVQRAALAGLDVDVSTCLTAHSFKSPG